MQGSIYIYKHMFVFSIGFCGNPRLIDDQNYAATFESMIDKNSGPASASNVSWRYLHCFVISIIVWH